MGSNNGTGQPNWFRCAKCRRGGHRNDGWLGSVDLTGRRRQHRGKVGQRITHIDREYRCVDCGHVGWSAHVDLCHKAGDHPMSLWRERAIYLPSYVKREVADRGKCGSFGCDLPAGHNMGKADVPANHSPRDATSAALSFVRQNQSET